MPLVDVSHLERTTLIRELWKNMRPASFFQFTGMPMPPEPSDEEIIILIKRTGGDIDYLAGRCIKTNFQNMKKVDTRFYDRDAGPGAFEKVVAKLTI